MSKVKPSLPKGTRDFLPNEVMQRKYIFNTIKNVLEHYGFVEIETPAFERLETLTGKYGEEGDRLLFKILNSGDFLSKVDDTTYQEKNSTKLLKDIAEKGLRYDLTVPLARYVVQHQGDLTFPFKRYHVAPVWRADRPQRGRYQEFYQFDADIISADSLFNDVELSEILIEVFKRLQIPVTIKINNRKLLEALAIYANAPEQLVGITSAIDKLDKVGMEGVTNELEKIGLNENQIQQIKTVLAITDITALEKVFASIEIGRKGIEEIQFIFDNIDPSHVQFDITLARGLTYYTGTIWEVTANNVQMGSISGGGRYDNLTEMFGGQNMSGIGISFGVERIYDVMEELQLFPSNIVQGVKVLLVPREENNTNHCYDLVKKFRSYNISCELFTGNIKKQKQFNYATAKNISFIMEIGIDEIESSIYRIKNISSREEQKLSIDAIIEQLK